MTPTTLVGNPEPVFTDWVETVTKSGEKKRKPKKYIKRSEGEITYLHPGNMPSLSPKAQHVQDVLQGIAATIRADHTFDLSRLLRWPGSMNRKDERSGREPIPCKLIQCDATARYSFSAFEVFAAKSPGKERREKVAKVSLPATRKLTANKSDKLAELIVVCDATEIGHRSEADFSLCCYCVEHGISQSEVWARVQGVGKFAESGEGYFQTTWAAAESRTREKIFDRAASKATTKATAVAAPADDDESESSSGVARARRARRGSYCC